MGLDMYLNKKTYVKQWDHQTPEEKFEVTVTKGSNPFDSIQSKRVKYIEEEVGYWRKANQIHNWFVQNVQEGVDDCKEYYVGIDDVMNLLEICKQVKEKPEKAEELLPSTSGFFFGNTEYDEWYFNDIDYTIEVLEGLLKETYKTQDGKEYFTGEIYYQSSW